MPFQQTVQRQYTTGFVGDIVRDGPKRAKPGRIASATVGTDPGASTNRIGRAFGFTADLPAQGNTRAAMANSVSVGGPVFFGLLGHPKHYALAGTTVGGSLAPTIDLPLGANAEFFDMVTGLVVELVNETTGAKTVNFGDQIAYVPNNISTGNNPLALPYGSLVAVAPGAAAPTGMILIPNARVQNPITMSASAVGAIVSGVTIGQLTQ
jgi:hypothetical protein